MLWAQQTRCAIPDSATSYVGLLARSHSFINCWNRLKLAQERALEQGYPLVVVLLTYCLVVASSLLGCCRCSKQATLYPIERHRTWDLSHARTPSSTVVIA